MSVALLLGVVAWVYWPTLSAQVDRWENDARYSHGYLVPPFAVALLWMRWKPETAASLRPARWVGLGLLAAGILLRLAGAYIYFDWIEAISLLPTLAGIVALVLGPAGLRLAWPSIAFLAFMIPLPYRLETALGLPLQGLATVSSTFLLQAMGFPAVAEGNVIAIGEARLGVVEACNGMGIMLLFFAFSTGAALVVVDRRITDRLIVVASAVPIALISNVLRITLTATLHELAGGVVADFVYHDLAGWLMMPMALVLLWLELKLLDLLFIDVVPESGDPTSLAGRTPAEESPATHCDRLPSPLLTDPAQS
ncbi:exosortase/archaeosortase family protein [Tautonia sociabilis]|uniref:exosortase/archaeosortase family protein n=1 Tax=Tautonia sociabilis TaxID=2080755 RepID=UPI001315AE05|nr:exosortase/archaeosortase family protein [Tautonia sociabilis]